MEFAGENLKRLTVQCEVIAFDREDVRTGGVGMSRRGGLRGGARGD
jgi:hypothetical protein